MPEHIGSIVEGLRPYLGDHDPRSIGLSTTAYGPLPVPAQTIGVKTGDLLAFVDRSVSGPFIRGFIGELPRELAGKCAASLQDNWFERIIVVPSSLDLGNVLSTLNQNLELINLFRDVSLNWTAFNNNAGAGITATNLPGLTHTILPLGNFNLNIEISTNGPPTIIGDLEFVTDQGNILVPLTGSRIILFPFQPNENLEETLEFNTDVLTSADGGEQRMRLRRAPRQIMQFIIQDFGDNERDRLNAMMFDWQARVFGVPVWWEQRLLQTNMNVSDTVVQIDTTFADFRVGSLIMLWDGFDSFETFSVDAITSNSLTLQSGVLTARTAGQTLIMPVRTAITGTDIGQRRSLTGPTATSIKFTALDNIDLSDVSSFPTYESRVLIDKLNKSDRTKTEGLNRKLEVLDDGISQIQQRSSWTKSKPKLDWRLKSDDQQEIWEIRQLLHFLGGRHTSFWLGTGRSDIVPIIDIVDLAGTIDMEFIDFGTFYQQVLPRKDFQIIRKDGTRSQHRIAGSSVVTPNEIERLSFSPVVSPALPLVDIDRIEFLTLTRIESDKVKITHTRPNDATFNMQTIGLTK